jgi:hypothetical protein
MLSSGMELLVLTFNVTVTLTFVVIWLNYRCCHLIPPFIWLDDNIALNIKCNYLVELSYSFCVIVWLYVNIVLNFGVLSFGWMITFA